jgi:hypothetical protein
VRDLVFWIHGFCGHEVRRATTHPLGSPRFDRLEPRETLSCGNTPLELELERREAFDGAVSDREEAVFERAQVERLERNLSTAQPPHEPQQLLPRVLRVLATDQQIVSELASLACAEADTAVEVVEAQIRKADDVGGEPLAQHLPGVRAV